jgi:ATP-dependent exoDNAse (exonuclease V) alpha subunit
VEAGDAFRLMEKEAGVRLARLTEIRRQTDPKYKKAVEAIAEGTGKSAQKGFDALDRMGGVIEASGDQRHQLLIADYLKAAEDGKSALIIAPTHAEGQKLTDELRAALKARGVIGEEQEAITWRGTGWTNAQKGDIRNYEPGMVVEFHQNIKGFTRGDKAVVAEGDAGLVLQKRDGTRAEIPLDKSGRYEVYRARVERVGKFDRIRITKNGEMKVEGQARGTRVNNGDIFTVEGFTKEGDFRLPNGRTMPRNFGHFSFGYVDTSYASQGKTVDRVFVALGKDSLAAANAKQWYVSLSRGREMAKVYVEDKTEVRDAIARTDERLSAVELTHTKLRSSWRHRVRESMERNRVTRFLKQCAAVIAESWRNRSAASRSAVRREEGQSYA